jgi:hypothetical protein
LEQLDKSDPPPAPITYPLLLAVQSLNSVIESQSLFVLPFLGSQNDLSGEDSIFLSIEMAKSASPSILSSLTLLSSSHIEDDLLKIILWSFHKFTVVLALLGLVAHRDAFLSSLCRICVPGFQMQPADNPNHTQNQLTNLYVNRNTAQISLTDRNLQFVRILLSILSEISDVLDSKTWYPCLEALQIVEGLATNVKSEKKKESFIELPLINLATTGSSRIRNSPMSPFLGFSSTAASAVSDLNQKPYLAYSKVLFEESENMKLRPLTEFVRALCRLAHETISQISNKEKSEEKSYALTKLLLVTNVNLKRILLPEFSLVWDLITVQLIQMAHSPSLGSTGRSQVMHAFNEIIISSASIGDFKDESVERKIFEPLETIMGLDTIAEDTVKINWLPDVQRSGLETLNKLLQMNGQNFKAAWNITLDIIQAIGRGNQLLRKKVDTPNLETSPCSISLSINESPTANNDNLNHKTIMVTRIAFPCIELIATDFLPLLNPTILTRCIDTLSLYGSLADDLNISLTSVGLLWSVCDFILTKRHKLEGDEDVVEVDQMFKYKTTISLTKLDIETGILFLIKPL